MYRSHGLALLPLLLLTGCPTKAKPNPDATAPSDGNAKNDGAASDGSNIDGSKSDGSTSDAPPTTTTLQITSPASGAYTNGALAIRVTASGGTAPAAISLVLDGGSAIATLNAPSPYTFTWDTTGVADGPHTLVAKSTTGSPQIVSGPVTVNVDHTPPTVKTTVPATGATNVVLRAPITVTFSEAMAAASSAGIGLSLGGTAIASNATLSADGTSASIVIGDPTSFGLPGMFSVTFAATVTDVAGNALVQPAPAWSWAVPDFITYATIPGTGSNISNPVLAMSKTFQPVVALAQLFVSSSGSQENNTLHVEKSDGQAWIDLGRPSPNGDESYGFSMALGADDNPAVAWAEKGDKVYVSTWTGSAWGTASAAVDPAADPATLVSSPVVRLDPTGTPVLAWLEKGPPPSSAQSIFVTHLTSGGGSTGALGAIPVAGATALDLILDPQGNPIVAWRNGSSTEVDIFRGAELTSPALTVFADPTLGLDATSNPLLIAGTGGFGVFALSGGAWVLAPPAQIQIDGNAQSPKLRTDPAHNPVVGWLESGKFTYERWTGTAWDSRAGIFGDAETNQSFDMVVDSRGTVWLMGCNPSRALVIMSNY
jgi:Bacterial Ig-like domain/Bacterial Ig domain